MVQIKISEDIKNMLSWIFLKKNVYVSVST